jgi:hypothetical protein
MFTAYDVIVLMSESGSAFWVKTVFTAVLCAEDDFLPYGFR